MIKIITLHDICNPGSVLQAYALNKFLCDSGYACEIIDYVPPYSHIGKNKIKGIIKNVLFGKAQRAIKKKYCCFMQENMRLTPIRYNSYRELEKCPPEGKVFIAGSDQLWNLDYDCGRDEAYYLSFVKNAYKISYATSLGKSDVSDKDLRFIAERAKSFDFVSVREKSSCALLEKYLPTNVEWVCDPVFLLDKKVYLKKCKRSIAEPYIVIYLSEGTELLKKVINNVKNETGYKVVLLGGSITRCSCDLHIKDMGPEDFLSLIYYSEAVLSSSFHATAFSHIFHKKFGAILPEKNGERIESLLGLSGLENHIIRNEGDFKALLNEIDYTEVDKRLGAFVDKSKESLLTAIDALLA